MSVNELKIQSLLVDACKEAGGFGYKQSNKFLAGPPDLYLSHPSTGPVFIEVKLNEPTQKTVLVTPLQELTIRKMQLAGTKCAVAVVVPLSSVVGGYDIYMTTDPERKKLSDDPMVWRVFYKNRGEKWPIIEMMKFCSLM